MRQPPTEAGGLRPPVEREVRPELTPERLTFWASELRALPEHQRPAILKELENHYGAAAAERVRQAVPV